MKLFVGTLLATLVWAFSARASETLISLDVGLNDITINKVPFLIAADNGIYERNGLDVHQFITPEAAARARQSGVIVPPETVREGVDRSPIVVGGASPTIYGAVYKGEPDRVVLASLEDVVKGHIIAAPSIRTLDDLRGKRIGYAATGRAGQIGILSFARRMGWTPGRDIILVQHASTIADIMNGRTDAIFGGAVEAALAPKSGLNDVVDLEQYHLPFAGSGINVERSWLRDNRDTAAHFVKSAVEAVALMKNDRGVFDAAIAKWLNIHDPQAQRRLYMAAIAFPAKPYPSVEGIRTIMEVYDSPKMRADSAKDFYDSSFVEALDRSGFLDTLNQ
jgi:NitT/TauT family transport system substrate-binding protein